MSSAFCGIVSTFKDMRSKKQFPAWNSDISLRIIKQMLTGAPLWQSLWKIRYILHSLHGPIIFKFVKKQRVTENEFRFANKQETIISQNDKFLKKILP